MGTRQATTAGFHDLPRNHGAFWGGLGGPPTEAPMSKVNRDANNEEWLLALAPYIEHVGRKNAETQPRS
jgi:hypothetical protein